MYSRDLHDLWVPFDLKKKIKIKFLRNLGKKYPFQFLILYIKQQMILWFWELLETWKIKPWRLHWLRPLSRTSIHVRGPAPSQTSVWPWCTTGISMSLFHLKHETSTPLLQRKIVRINLVKILKFTSTTLIDYISLRKMNMGVLHGWADFRSQDLKVPGTPKGAGLQ